jgi:hypothetical protein
MDHIQNERNDLRCKDCGNDLNHPKIRERPGLQKPRAWPEPPEIKGPTWAATADGFVQNLPKIRERPRLQKLRERPESRKNKGTTWAAKTKEGPEPQKNKGATWAAKTDGPS